MENHPTKSRLGVTALLRGGSRCAELGMGELHRDRGAHMSRECLGACGCRGVCVAGNSPLQSGERAERGFVHNKAASTTHRSPTCSQYVSSITSPVCLGTKQPQSPFRFLPAILQSLFSPYSSPLLHTKPQFVLETPRSRSTDAFSYRQGAKAPH